MDFRPPRTIVVGVFHWSPDLEVDFPRRVICCTPVLRSPFFFSCPILWSDLPLAVVFVGANRLSHTLVVLPAFL